MARKILGIAGSLRGGSYSKAVLRTLAEQSWEGVEIEIFDISSIPFYNADQDGEHPPDPVQKLKELDRCLRRRAGRFPRIQLRDSGRPQKRPGLGFPSGLQVAPGRQAGGYYHLALLPPPGSPGSGRHPRLFYGCLAEVVPYMEVAISTVQDKVQGGKLTDEKSLAMASGLVKALGRRHYAGSNQAGASVRTFSQLSTWMGPMGRGLWVLPGGQRERVLRACPRLNASRAASWSRSLGAQIVLEGYRDARARVLHAAVRLKHPLLDGGGAGIRMPSRTESDMPLSAEGTCGFVNSKIVGGEAGFSSSAAVGPDIQSPAKATQSPTTSTRSHWGRSRTVVSYPPLS